MLLEDGTAQIPVNVEQAKIGAAQEWKPLHQGPVPRWEHQCLTFWRDAIGNQRASPNLLSTAAAAPGSDLRRLGLAYLLPGLVEITDCAGGDIVRVEQGAIHTKSLCLQCTEGKWTAQRLQPCAGPKRVLLAANGLPPFAWSLDRWEYSRVERLPVVLITACPSAAESMQAADLVRPLSLEERRDVLRRGRASRPGPSGFKMAFLPFFPDWLQEALWFSLDVQRECGMRADHSSWALQINVAKPKGGWRPLTMLEETFKAVEGPVTRRLTQWRSRMEPGCLYSDLNRAYEVGVSAAPLVLYLDAMIVEDAFFWRRDICRVAADYEKFFNAVTLAASDAVMQARAVPPEVRRLYTAAFSGIKLRVQTRWGPSLPILVSRGLPQGSVSAPELSKAAQDPLLRLRERSDAAYTTSAGLKVGAAGYVDDTEHYADGARQLQLMTADLRLGSEGTGIGFCWPKCSAFATDWLPYMRHAAPPRREINEMGVLAGGWDIWHGGVAEATIPRAHEDTQETLLGKLGTLQDRHSAAAQVTLDRLVSARQLIVCQRCTWDEAAMVYQLRVRGFLGYACLMGIPPAMALHEEDAAFQRLVLERFGTRCTAERVSLLAASRDGGVQLPSVVESVVAAAAHDVLMLLCGEGMASCVARDQLRQAMQQDPESAEDDERLIPRAMRFLSQYGFHVTTGTDRTVGRILDQLAARHRMTPCPLVGLYRPALARAAASFCRVGHQANAIRRAVASLRSSGVPPARWSDPAVWTPLLQGTRLDAASCAAAAEAARQQAETDWAAEAALFGGHVSEDLPEDWPESAWSQPHLPAPRVAGLAAIFPHGFPPSDYALYSDGGDSGGVCTYSAQARAFGPLGGYWERSRQVSVPILGRLPERYGYEASGVHLAEFVGMLCALRWRRPGDWNLLVCDRSALFAALRRSHCPSRWAHFPLESVLRAVLDHLQRSWRGGRFTPSWRLDVETHPEKWNVRREHQGHTRTMVQVAFDEHGLVGVDVKSHQQGDPCPYPVIIEGNEQQDEGCRQARLRPQPPDIFLPAGSLFAFLVWEGRMITTTTREAVRRQLRLQACQQWKLRRVQGKIARLGPELYRASMHPRHYTQITIPIEWRTLALPQDGDVVDISGFQFRCLRAIGGGWSELLHAHAESRQCAEDEARRQGRPVRVCPLCLTAAGTPRHVVMNCPAMRPLVDHVRDLVEEELLALGKGGPTRHRASPGRRDTVAAALCLAVVHHHTIPGSPPQQGG